MIYDFSTAQRLMLDAFGACYMDWNSDGTNLIAENNGNLSIFDPVSGNEIITLPSVFLEKRGLDWSANDAVAASIDLSNAIRVYDMGTQQNTLTIQLIDTYPVTDMELSPDGSLLAVVTAWTDTGQITIWDTTNGNLLSSITQSDVFAVTWSPDGSQLTYVGNFLEEIISLVLPNANAGLDQSISDSNNSGDESIILDGSASTDSDGTIISYVWTENGVEIATGADPEVDLTVGTHLITLTVTDDDGATGSDIVEIIVNAGQ